MDWLLIALIFFPSLFGGLFQTLTGFGSGILLMMILPAFMPLLQAASVSSVTAIYLTAILAYRLRKSVNWQCLPLPTIVFFTFSGLAIHTGPHIDTRLLEIVFGLFLISLALWFFLEGKRKGSFRMTSPRAAGISALAGTTSGWFGLSGPPMVVYFLSTCGDDKERYLATTQTFFFGVVVFNSVVRMAEGILTPDLLFLALWGVVGITLGKFLGLRLLNKIDLSRMRTLIYYGLAVSGLLTVLKNIF